MNRNFQIILLLLSMTAGNSANGMFRPATVMADGGFIDTNYASPETYEPSVGTLDKINGIVDTAQKALRYIGREKVVNSLYSISAAINKFVPQIGLCITGSVTALWGIKIIKDVALNDNVANAKKKYRVGTALSALGFSLIATSWLIGRN